MPVRNEDILNVLRKEDLPLTVDDIVDKLNLDESIESKLKTTPKKRVSTSLRYLEGRNLVKKLSFGVKGVNHYRCTDEMIKNLIIEVMVSNLHSIYKTEFMQLMAPVLSDDNRAILEKEINERKEILKYKDQVESKKKQTYFS